MPGYRQAALEGGPTGQTLGKKARGAGVDFHFQTTARGLLTAHTAENGSPT